MQTIIKQAGDWAISSDGVQWILNRVLTAKKDGRRYLNPCGFVRSTKAIMARCLTDHKVPAKAARALLATLPDSFDIWNQSASGLAAGDAGAIKPDEAIELPPPDKQPTGRHRRPPLARRGR